MTLYNKNSALTILLSLFITYASAQNNTLSPYSLSALGEMSYGHFAQNRALSGVSSSLFSKNAYNLVNPATLGHINKTVFDFGVRAERGTLSKEGNFKDYNNGNFNYFALGFSILKKEKHFRADTSEETGRITGISKSKNIVNWATGFSLMPYSSMGGEFLQSQDTLGFNPLFLNKSLGDLTSVAINNGIKITDYFSIGHSVSFVWGQNYRNRGVSFPDSQFALGLVDQNFSKYNGFVHNLGLGFELPIRNKFMLSGGLSYRMPHNLNRQLTRTVTSFDFRNSLQNPKLDTLINSESEKQKISLPSHFTGGLSFTAIKKFRISGEYAFQNWSSVTTSWNEPLADYNRLSVGLTINPDSEPLKSMSKPEIYFGYNRGNLHAIYINNNGNLTSIQEYGISFGLGLPVVRDVFTADGKRSRFRSMINLSAEYISRGGNTPNTIKEELFRLTVGLTLTDLWFIKRKYR
jgi:hypothetical protein